MSAYQLISKLAAKIEIGDKPRGIRVSMVTQDELIAGGMLVGSGRILHNGRGTGEIADPSLWIKGFKEIPVVLDPDISDGEYRIVV